MSTRPGTIGLVVACLSAGCAASDAAPPTSPPAAPTATPTTPTATPTTPTATALPDRVSRGNYLAHVGGCGDCHTPGGFAGAPDETRLLSGSEIGWQGPWGTTYPRNLTPHAETGIGSWTEQEIVTAIRTGVRPDGTVLRPPMPWQQYAYLTDEDALAIAAYLKSIAPVEHVSPATLPPGEPAPQGAVIIQVPPPPQWDAPKGTPAGKGTR